MTEASKSRKERLIRAALRWYRVWKRDSHGDGPLPSNGWGADEIALYRAAKRYLSRK